MHRTPLTSLLSVVLAGVVAPFALAQVLPSDPALVTGQLDNGLRYIIRQHDKPPGRAVIWLQIHSGSLNETDPQRGIAHYLEHMAFNGSKNFPPGSVVPFFQSLGMTFGRDQNAFTSFDQTTSRLSLPGTAPETRGQGLTFSADVLHRLSLLPDEIEAERQIILEERRSRLSGRQRTGDYVRERTAPGSLYGMRSPIGVEETIRGVGPADFRDYYEKWYTASNATLIVVADAPPGDVIAVIKARFDDAPARPRPAPQAANVRAYDKSFAIVASDPEIRFESLDIMRVEPPRPPTTTVEQYRTDLVDRLGQSAFNRRLGDKASRGGTGWQNARVSSGTQANIMHSASVSTGAAPGRWRSALSEIALELQRARTFGFTSREIDDAKGQRVSAAERAVEPEASQQAQTLISRINSAVATGEPILSPRQRLELLGKLLPTITVEQVSRRFAQEFDPRAVAFVAVLPAGDGVPSEAELLDLGLKALAQKPAPEAESARATELMSAPPTPGKVSDGVEHSASGVWSGWLSNNVRVHHRFMDERKNDVSLSISLIGGELHETAETRGITQAAQLAWSRPATRKLSSTDIRELMTAKKISVGGAGGAGRGGGRRGGGGGGGAEAISLSISGSPGDLETGLQLAYLLLTEPLIEPSAFEQYQTRTRESLREAETNPLRAAMRIAAAAPYPEGEPRTRPLTIEDVDRLTLDAAQAWLEKLIRRSPIEVVIVGDVSRAQALDLAVRYLGALPQRERVSPQTCSALRKLARPTGPRTFERTVASETDQAFVLSGFYGADESNVADVRALNMAARILSTRMVREVREEAQLVYSISAASRPASAYPGFGVFSASAPTEPAKTAALVEKLASMYASFAEHGPTADELDVAKKQMANTLVEQMRDPGYWSRRLSQLTFRGADVDDILAEPVAYDSLTAEQVRNTFRKYCAAQNGIVVVVTPGAG